MDVKDSHFGFHRSYIPFIGSGCRLMRPRFQACANYPSCSDDTTSGYNPTTSGYNPTSESTAPPTPPAPPAPVGKPASWGESKTYSDPTYGISFSYPKSWATNDTYGDQVFAAVDSKNPRTDNVILHVIPSSANIAEAVKESCETTLKSGTIGSVIKMVSTKSVTLADGKTPATEVIMSISLNMATLKCNGEIYALAITKGDKIVFVAAGNCGGSAEQVAMIREIASTLAVK